MKIYDIPAALRELIDEETGEIRDEAALAALEAEFNDKIDWLAGLTREYAAEAEAIDNAANDLFARAQSFKNKATSTKAFIYRLLEQAGTTKVKGKFATVFIANGPEALDISDATRIPENFYKTPPAVLDRAALKQALQDGVKVSGATLVRTPHLTIKMK